LSYERLDQLCDFFMPQIPVLQDLNRLLPPPHNNNNSKDSLRPPSQSLVVDYLKSERRRSLTGVSHLTI
jgi:hypothetical protein